MYHLFVYSNVDIREFVVGGMTDYVGSYATLQEAKSYFNDKHERESTCDWYVAHAVIDTNRGLETRSAIYIYAIEGDIPALNQWNKFNNSERGEFEWLDGYEE